MNEQHTLSGDIEAVWRLVDLRAHSTGGVGAERFTIAVVSPKNPEHRHSALVERSQAEWRTVIAGVHHHVDALVRESLQQIGDCRYPVVTVRHDADLHGDVLQL